MAVEVSKASVVKKKLITKYHQLHLYLDSGKDRKNVSKFHRQDNLTEELSIQQNFIPKVLSQLESKTKGEAIEDTGEGVNSIKFLINEKANIESLPLGSTVVRIIVSKGFIIEKVYQTPTGSNISVLF